MAAGQRTLRPSIAGVPAVALTREEEYVERVRGLRGRGRRPTVPEMVEVYAYLPAADARALFGADTPWRWFQPVEARNHSFGGARAQLYDAMERSLTWLALASASSSRPSPAAPPG